MQSLAAMERPFAYPKKLTRGQASGSRQLARSEISVSENAVSPGCVLLSEVFLEQVKDKAN